MDKKALLDKVNTLDEKGLKDLLRELKLYQDLQQKLWKRWQELFERKENGEKLYVVEYFPSISEDVAWEQAEGIYKKAFDENVSRDKVKFISKEALLWGMKVYLDDSMVDLSFSKIEQLIKN